MKNMGEKRQRILWSSLSLTLLFIVWHLSSQLPSMRLLLPSPIDVISFVYRSVIQPIGSLVIGQHILWSLSRVTVGYLLAVVVGISLGFLGSWFKVGEAIIKPFYLFLRSIPSLAWIPLSILWFGIGENSKYYIIFITAVMIIMTNVMDGVKSVNPELLGVARMLGTKENQLFFNVVLPCAIPQIFNGLQVAIGAAWASVLAAEMISSTKGVGWIILAGQNSANMIQIFAGILVIGCIGLLLASLMRALEAKLCSWNVRGK